jgi:hypothetical protein
MGVGVHPEPPVPRADDSYEGFPLLGVRSFLRWEISKSEDLETATWHVTVSLWKPPGR